MVIELESLNVRYEMGMPERHQREAVRLVMDHQQPLQES